MKINMSNIQQKSFRFPKGTGLEVIDTTVNDYFVNSHKTDFLDYKVIYSFNYILITVLFTIIPISKNNL